MKTGDRFFFITITMIVLLMSCLFVTGCIKEGNIQVQDMNIKADHITASYVTLNVTSNIQNTDGIGNQALEVQLRAFNIESGLLETEQTDTVPGVGWGETRSVSQAITLPRKGSYNLVVTVLKDNKYKGQGRITVSNLERLIPDTQQSGLIIEDMDFIVRKVTGSSAVIQTDVYVANGGRIPSGLVIVEVKAKEMDAHLTADKQQATITNIDPEKIGVASVPLTVPDQYNYNVEAIIWRNETIVKRGEGVVQLRPGKLISNNSQFTSVNIDTSKFVKQDGQMASSPYSPSYQTKSPGFSVPCTIITLVAIGALMVTLRRRT